MRSSRAAIGRSLRVGDIAPFHTAVRDSDHYDVEVGPAEYDVSFQDWEEYWSAYAEPKGSYAGALVRAGGKSYRLTFYDPTRLSQEIADALATGAPFVAERNTVVIERVTKEVMLLAIESLAGRSFADLEPSDIPEH